jgi:hypothetical protein
METAFRMTRKQAQGWSDGDTYQKRSWRRHVRKKALAKAEKVGAEVVAITAGRRIVDTLEVA